MNVIHWFRRDLRLTDNPALHHAAQEGNVVPVYVLSTWHAEHAWTGAKRQHFLAGCLHSLAANLTQLGTTLIIRQGDPVEELEALALATKAGAIYYNRSPDPVGKAAEVRLQRMCARHEIRCEGFQDVVLHEAHEVLTGAGLPYRVFTPYANNWLALPKAPPLERVRSLGSISPLASLPLPTLEHWGLSLPEGTQLLAAGERAARIRMKKFIANGNLDRYHSLRDSPSGGGNSMLSQDLRFGLISIRELYALVSQSTTDSALTYRKELAWREFYLAVLDHWPEVLSEEFHPDWKGMIWPGTEEHFTAWSQGRTGFPIVDAGMRQLLTTGLMHNRIRMIVAMFLTKDLHCDWRWGEQFFHQHLLDAEIGSNNGGWQWSAGTGADAAPYFRIQNPWLQTQRHDPEGRYIKHWLPELRDVAPAEFCAPPKNHRPLAPDYPLPIVDHAVERARTLACFTQHKARR